MRKNNEIITTRSLCVSKEEYLFKVAEKTLKWAKVSYTKEELADLVMLELLDIK